MSNLTDTVDLFRAIESGRKEEILQVLEDKKIDLSRLSMKHKRKLHLIFQNEYLAENDMIELLQTFFVQGVDPNIRDEFDKTFLQLAVNNEIKYVVDFLIQNYFKISTYDKITEPITSDYVANERDKIYELLTLDESHFNASIIVQLETMERESSSFTEWMIFKGFDFNHRNKDRENALYTSMRWGLHHISLVLLQHTQDINFIDRPRGYLLDLFIYNCHCKSIIGENEIKNKWYSDYNARYTTKIIKLLLDKGFPDEDAYETCLQKAIACKMEENVIEMLTDYRLNKCGKNSATAMFEEVMKISDRWGESRTQYIFTVLNKLVSIGANKYTNASLYYAFRHQNQQAIDYLDDGRLNFTSTTDCGENLLHALARNDTQNDNQEKWFDFLLSKGCNDVNRKNIDNETPLHCACKSQQFSIVRKLIEHGADVNCKDKYGMTPLHLIACYNQNEKLANFLLENGADVNAKHYPRETRSLHYAARASWSLPLVSTLLRNGSYINVRTIAGESALFKAIERDCTRNIEEMLAYGADINDQRIVSLLAKFLPECASRKIVLQHWIKLKIVGLPCLQEFEVFVVGDEKLQEFYEDCRREIEVLKNTFVDSRTSIYSFLLMNYASKRIYVNNEELKNLLKSPNLEKLFPKYSVVVLASYREIVAWKKLLEPAKCAWRKLTNVELFEECIELIFSYLRIEDLVSMIEYYENI